MLYAWARPAPTCTKLRKCGRTLRCYQARVFLPLASQRCPGPPSCGPEELVEIGFQLHDWEVASLQVDLEWEVPGGTKCAAAAGSAVAMVVMQQVTGGDAKAHMLLDCQIPACLCPCPMDPCMHACTGPMHACLHQVPTPACLQGPMHCSSSSSSSSTVLQSSIIQ